MTPVSCSVAGYNPAATIARWKAQNETAKCLARLDNAGTDIVYDLVWPSSATSLPWAWQTLYAAIRATGSTVSSFMFSVKQRDFIALVTALLCRCCHLFCQPKLESVCSSLKQLVHHLVGAETVLLPDLLKQVLPFWNFNSSIVYFVISYKFHHVTEINRDVFVCWRGSWCCA